MTENTKKLLTEIITAECIIADKANRSEEAEKALVFLHGYSSAILNVMPEKEKEKVEL